MNSRARHVTNVVSFTNVSHTGGAVSRVARSGGGREEALRCDFVKNKFIYVLLHKKLILILM